MIRKYSAHYILPVSGAPLKYGILVIGSNGEIIDVIDNQGEFKEIASLEFFDGILVPGFVCSHAISQQQVFYQLQENLRLKKDISFSEGLRKVTLEASKMLHCDHIMGSFEKGKTPGINHISAIDFKNMSLTENSRLQQLVSPANF